MVIRLSKEKPTERYNNNDTIIPAAIPANRQQNFLSSRELFCCRLRLQEYAARTARLFILQMYYKADKIDYSQGREQKRKKFKNRGTFC